MINGRLDIAKNKKIHELENIATETTQKEIPRGKRKKEKRNKKGR